MKHRVAVCLFVFFVCAGSIQANAELSLDEKVKELKRNLELTDDQVRNIRPIISEYKSSIDRAKETKERKLEKILSPQQMQILEKLDEENMQGGLPK